MIPVQFLQMIGLMQHTLIGAVKRMSSFRHPLSIREEGGGDSASFRYLEFNPEEILYVIMRKSGRY